MRLPYKIADGHTHVHPDRKTNRLFLDALKEHKERTGEIPESLEMMRRNGIGKTVILPWMSAHAFYAEEMALSKAQVGSLQEAEIKRRLRQEWTGFNQWAREVVKQYRDKYSTLVAINPPLLGEAWAESEIERGLADGAIGLKIVTYSLGVPPTDERVQVVWREANRRGLPVVAQTSGVSPGAIAHPSSFEEVLRAYPKAKVIMAHIGNGGGEESVARLAGMYANCYTDTSYWLENVGKSGGYTLAGAAALFRRIGIDRVIFGSNYPICEPAQYIDVIMAMPLTDDERHKIFVENYQTVFKDVV